MSVLKVQYFSNDPEFTVPTIAYGDGAGYDLYSGETITILPHSCEGVNFKFNMAIPQGYFGKIYSRSGLVKRKSITAEGGIIDSGFRGNLFVFLFNHGKELFTVKPGDKIAQMVFMKKETVEFVRVDDFFKLGKTERGTLRFGSSDSKKVKIQDEAEIVVEDAVMSSNGKILVSDIHN